MQQKVDDKNTKFKENVRDSKILNIYGFDNTVLQCRT